MWSCPGTHMDCKGFQTKTKGWGSGRFKWAGFHPLIKSHSQTISEIPEIDDKDQQWNIVYMFSAMKYYQKL